LQFRTFPLLAVTLLAVSCSPAAQAVEGDKHLPDDTAAILSIDWKAFTEAKPASTTVGKALTKLFDHSEIAKLFAKRLSFNVATDPTRIIVALVGKDLTPLILMYGKWDTGAFIEHFPRLMKAQTNIEISAIKFEELAIQQNDIGSRRQAKTQYLCVVGPDLCAMSSDEDCLRSLIHKYNAKESKGPNNEVIRGLIAKVDQKQVVWFVASPESVKDIPALKGVQVPPNLTGVHGQIAFKKGISISFTLEGIAKMDANDLIDKMDVGFANYKPVLKVLFATYVRFAPMLLGVSIEKLFDFLGLEENEDALIDFFSFNKLKLDTSTGTNTMKAELYLPWIGK